MVRVVADRYVLVPRRGGHRGRDACIPADPRHAPATGLPPIEKYRNDYPKNYSEKSEQELTTKEIFFKYVLNNKILWYIAFANAFVYLVRYGVLDWAPTYLKDIKGYDIKDVGWAYSAYEWAAIPGTIICGWLSDKVFKGRRAITTMIYMALVAVFIVIYWKNMDNVLLDNISLIAIGFLIYGPVMLIGVQALDLAPKKAAGTAAGLTGFFGYFFGTAILANIAMGSIVQHLAGTGDSSCCSRRAHWPSSSSVSPTGKNNIWLNNGNSKASRRLGRPLRSEGFLL